METLRQSTLDALSSPDSFLWLTGIEDTFITDPWPKTGRTLDEYELTGHYERWREDLLLMKELGVQHVRYGVPWHRINPAPGQWDFSFADQTLEFLLELKIDPVVDLVHYGLPRWIKDAFLNPDFPKYMAEYSSRLAERFRGRIHAYTPLNEPRVTAWYSGKLGWWPPQRRGWRGFVEVMLGVCRGMVETTEALENVDPEILPVHVDATDLYESLDPVLQVEVTRRQDIVFLALDLISGRIDEGHSLWQWLLKHGATEEQLEWFLEHAVDLPLIGINMYPLFSRKILSNSRHGLRTRMPYATADIVYQLGRMYHERYHAPILISETASLGSVKRRLAWLESSIQEVARLRTDGIPLVGYTWWPMFALVTWAYRQGEHPPAYYLKQMGLWDLDDKLSRVATPLVKRYQELASSGAAEVGPMRRQEILRGDRV